MLSNKEVAKLFKLSGQLMELHDENPFKIRSYSNAAFNIERLPKPVLEMPEEELAKVKGIGKGIAAKLKEIRETDGFQELTELLEKTPVGVIDMLAIKGIGPKKIRVVWQELEVESIGELLYACNENRLVDLKGFGEKTQQRIQKQIEFMQANADKVHYAKVEELALKLEKALQNSKAVVKASITGQLRRRMPVIEKLEWVADSSDQKEVAKTIDNLETEHEISDVETDENNVSFIINQSLEGVVHLCENEDFEQILFSTTGSAKHLELIGKTSGSQTEEDIYKAAGWPFIIPELREGMFEEELKDSNKLDEIIELPDLKGILHNHSTYSDGLHSLREMAEYCKELGYEYLGMSDHSKSAFYANGLSPERIAEQQKEIDALNQELKPFKIFKGIESDILNDGSLDYEEEVLKSFDFIVASVHSILKMEEERATNRLITAVENPYTTILGHPTGRLLLSREGYPINHKKVIDACAANKVVIELNANPFRLDLDWTWIPYAMKKGVMISINPDAHKKSGYYDMHYGTLAARKGALSKNMTFNALPLEKVEKWFAEKRAVVS